MPTCNSCNAKVLRTDAFCGTCGEPVPGAKPVVPLTRPSATSGTHRSPEAVTGTFSPSSELGASGAHALAAAAISEPTADDPRDTGVNQTTIRERSASEPAPVVPLHRRKEPEPPQEIDESPPEDREVAAARPPISERETSLPNIPVPAGPPILASDLLREQMRPASPGAKTLRWVTVASCAIGMAVALLTGGLQPLTFVSAALLIMMGTLALTPLSYRARAISLFLVGAAATGVALWQQVEHDVAPEGVILAVGTILLSGSLLFRAYYRGAKLARYLVALGVAIVTAWFLYSGGHESLVTLEGHWQSWAPAVSHVGFGLLALLSLMAFMESTTRGGAHVWAYALLALYVTEVGLLISSQLFPRSGVSPGLEGPAVAVLITGAVGTVVAGLALAQIFVAFSQPPSNRLDAAD